MEQGLNKQIENGNAEINKKLNYEKKLTVQIELGGERVGHSDGVNGMCNSFAEDWLHVE